MRFGPCLAAILQFNLKNNGKTQINGMFWRVLMVFVALIIMPLAVLHSDDLFCGNFKQAVATAQGQYTGVELFFKRFS